jgi:hypothetical protein
MGSSLQVFKLQFYMHISSHHVCCNVLPNPIHLDLITLIFGDDYTFSMEMEMEMEMLIITSRQAFWYMREDIFKPIIQNDSLHKTNNQNGVIVVNFVT